MNATSQLKELLFRAEKIVDNNQVPTKYRVRGYPDDDKQFNDYTNYNRDFDFISYQDVIAGGLLRCKRLFDKPLTDIDVHKMYVGRNKQWFTCELISKNSFVKIDGETHLPFLSVSYSYDKVNAIHYEIGIYRSKCTNGVLFGFKSLLKIKATPDNIFDVDLYYNPCMLKTLVQEYERQVKLLKNTFMDRESIRILTARATGINSDEMNSKIYIDKIGEKELVTTVSSLINMYTNELGKNAYAVLNVVTDLASHHHELNEDTTEKRGMNSTIKKRQAGKWLETLVDFIEKQNKVVPDYSIDSPNFGSKPVKERYDFSILAYLQYIKSKN